MAKENNNVEVQLEPGWENVEVDKSKGIGGCLYYCHEPDLDDVVDIKKIEDPNEGTKKEKLVDDWCRCAPSLKNHVLVLNKVMDVSGAKESHQVHQIVARKIKKIVLLPQYLLFVQ